VCETGFNWGGTSHIFLCSSRTNATVRSFELERTRSVAPNLTLIERYGSRMQLTIGSSLAILPKLTESTGPDRPDCGFVYVDGGHASKIAKSDMVSFAKLSRPGTPVVADDCFAEGTKQISQKGPKQAFNEMVAEGAIEPQNSVQFTDLTFRAVCVGKYIGPPPPAAPAAAAPTQAQWCNQLADDEAVFDCCYKEREGFKDLLAKRGVQVRGKTEAYGGWGSAAKDEVKLLAQLLRAEEQRAPRGKPFTVCETGFNWGGTSHIFLCSSRTNATVRSFELERTRSVAPNLTLIERYGSRMQLTIGSSLGILPKLAKSTGPDRPDCDFVYVDGGHDYHIAKADMVNFAKLSRPGTPMVADDCFAEGAKQISQVGPRKAFKEMVADRAIEPDKSVQFADLTFRAVCMGRYTGPHRV